MSEIEKSIELSQKYLYERSSVIVILLYFTWSEISWYQFRD